MYTSKTNFTKLRNRLGYKVTCHAKKRKKKIEKKCYNETRKIKKGKKEDHANEKREITIEGKEKMEKTNQLMEAWF